MRTTPFALAVALCVGCAGTAGEGDPPKPPLDDTLEPAVDTPTAEPDAAAIGPLRLTVAQARRALDTLAGQPFTADVSWPNDATRRGLAGQQEVAAIGQDLVDAVWEASSLGSRVWRDAVRGPTVAHAEIEALPLAHGCAIPGVARPGEVLWLDWGTAPISVDVEVASAVRYLVRLRAVHRPSQAGFSGAVVALDVDGVTRWGWDLGGAEDPTIVDVAIDLEPGPHRVAVRLPYGLEPAIEDSLYVVHTYCVEGNAVGYDWLEVVGPLDTDAVPCRPANALPPIAGLATPPPQPTTEACAAQTLLPLATRGWRRPVASASLDALTDVALAAWEDGAAWEDALADGWRAITTSPRFLARAVPGTAAARPLDAWERAERLALTVWGDLPDEELLACATSGGLTETDGACGWTNQVSRVLDDPRAAALADDFLVGWLGVDQLDAEDLPPGAPEAALDALRGHALAALRATLATDAPATDLLTVALPPLEPDIATWLGDASTRTGWLTTPGLLASLAEPWRSSPVRRGVYVLDRLRCDAPPAPPSDVPSLAAGPGDDAADVLDAWAQHRADPACATCHDAIDPIGLALEAWGPGGVARPTSPSTSQALDGTPLPDAAALARWLAASDDVDRRFTARFAGYALGREVRLDDVALDAWAPDTLGASWRDRIARVLASRAFLSWASADEVAP